MKSLFKKYHCGCVGIPVDSLNGLIVEPCDRDASDYNRTYFYFRDMRDKTYEDMDLMDQDELVRKLGRLIHLGEEMENLAVTIGSILNEKNRL